MTYRPPIDEILFTLAQVAVPPGSPPPLPADELSAILEEAGRFCAERIAPLDRTSDLIGARWEDGRVTTPPGFREAYADWIAGGWNAVAQPEAYGGSGLPMSVGTAAMEMFTSSCMALSTLPVLSQGAADAIEAHASDALKALYLPRLVSGEWTGTMNLTEPQAGSDLGLLRTRAEPLGEGRYRITGSKIFITFGAHDLAANIIHLVLARLPDAPAGVKGISLFLVPERFVAADGTLGAENDLRCAGIEHKLGIRGSPTCTMVFGDGGGAIGWLVGEENKGLACMFTMMNKARLATGLQGVAIAEKATQKAAAYALDRRQGRAAGFDGAAPIAAHPDLAKTLARMKALTTAARAIAYAAAAAIDGGDAGDARASLLTPVVKAFCTDIGCEVASLGIQVHGGMGFVEETGAAQLLRDIRIAPIYEGTNAIQAIDLVMRKIPREGGTEVARLIAESRADVARAENRVGPSAAILAEALTALEAATAHLLSPTTGEAAKLLVAQTYLRLFGLALGGALLSRGAAAAGTREADWIRLARIYAEDIAAEAEGLAGQVLSTRRDPADYRALAGVG
ncbi:UNVERIFIED_ORG: alkylation response protein AidB-like acyl-CoA dehydrogenase [Xanthobacter viscosus]|jgi:alkylation response protein AidB-like acyl-CoA dehydrogenase|uniref:3-methylmercaptopropionyl-CoA dehydrogenase n=1 Tax=Xanthobacter autotrophicus TaxID=280 RepID=A0A6C1KGU9_XANAU|nr:acyl-CoA dehydrogenase family protein [Xanthobacter autotrophicus]TLX43420.1 acyl-CoA dehydrogenase [Xanthobacter autotrophicus]